MAAKIGAKGLLVLNEKAPQDLRVAVATRGAVEVEIADKTGLGVCQVILPKGVSFPGYSQLLEGGTYAGHHLMDLHESLIAAP